MLIDTVGMSTLFLPDLQYHFHGMDPNWVDVYKRQTLHQSARIERTEKGFQIWIYNRTDYGTLLDQLEKQGDVYKRQLLRSLG